MAKSGTRGGDVRREFRLVEWLFLLYFILFRNDIVDGLFHRLVFANNFIMTNSSIINIHLHLESYILNA
jgi:hypothetical protein